MNPAIAEVETRPRNEIPENARRQNFAGGSQLSDPCRDVYGYAADIVRQDFNLARMQSGPDLQTEIAHGVADSLSATNGAGRTVEGGKKPVTHCPDFLAPKPREFATHTRIMPLQEVTPFAVAER